MLTAIINPPVKNSHSELMNIFLTKKKNQEKSWLNID